MDVELPVVTERHPDCTTCGSTSSYAVYRSPDHPIDLANVIAATEELPTGGARRVHPALLALRRGDEVDT